MWTQSACLLVRYYVLSCSEGSQYPVNPVSYTHLDVYKRQKSACLQNADRRRRIIKSIYMISVFILIAGIVRWRGYAFFNWCRSWTVSYTHLKPEVAVVVKDHGKKILRQLLAERGLCRRLDEMCIRDRCAAFRVRLLWGSGAAVQC